MIHVTKVFLPSLKDYEPYLAKIWESHQVTNNGPILQELENALIQYLQIPDIIYLANGTLALQLSLDAYNIHQGEVITTPYTYVATTSSILWEHNTPVFVDIDPHNFCMNPALIEKAITPNTKAILPVHAYGYPCDVEKIDAIGKAYNLPVIYDAAQAFGVKYKGQSIFSYGDIATASFHATKLFHTIEGGAVVTQHKDIQKHIQLAKSFGHTYDTHIQLGLNAKNTELHAAIGMCLLPYIQDLIKERQQLTQLYDYLLNPTLYIKQQDPDVEYNYLYFPILLNNEKELLHVRDALQKKNIIPRRYFYPAINTLPYIPVTQSCPIAEDIASRVLCLPLYNGLLKKEVQQIAYIVNHALESTS